MARKPRQDDERSMDSLMDAMTNVVGILLLILIVSSLGITQAVKKIVENMPNVTPEMLEALKASRKKTLDNLKDLKSTQASVEANKLKDQDAKQLALELEQFEKDNADLAEKTSDIEELLAKVELLKPEKEEKDQRNTEGVKQINDLEAALAAKGPPVVVQPRDIVLPDPRPADPEAFVYYVACKHNKLYVIGEPYELMIKIRDVLDASFTDLAYRGDEIGSYVYTLYSTKLDSNDRPAPFIVEYRARTRRAQEALNYMKQAKLKTLNNPEPRDLFTILMGASETQREAEKKWPVRKFRFDKNRIKAFFAQTVNKGDLNFYPQFPGDRVKIEIGLNPERGLAEDQFLSRGSPFVEVVKKASVNRRVIIMYYVSPDSFDTYLKAREYSTSQRVPAGWILWDGDKIPDLQPNKRREELVYNLEALPEGDYLKLCQAIGPKVAANVSAKISTFKEDTDKIPVPKDITGEEKIKEWKAGLLENRTQWANQIVSDVYALYQTPLAVSEATRSEEVLIQLHPPEVPHIRTFTRRGAPTAPKPPPSTKPRPKPTKKSLILD